MSPDSHATLIKERGLGMQKMSIFEMGE